MKIFDSFGLRKKKKNEFTTDVDKEELRFYIQWVDLNMQKPKMTILVLSHPNPKALTKSSSHQTIFNMWQH